MTDGIMHIKSSNYLETKMGSVIALAIAARGKSKYVVSWALEKFVPEGYVFFKLIYVRPQTIRVPTPMGNLIPIAEVRDDVAAAFRKEMDWQTNEKLHPYKIMCARKKVHVEVVQVESDDVVQGIVNEVARCKIDKLVIGTSSGLMLLRRKKHLSSRISECCPRFCTVYVVSKGKLSSVRPADSIISRSCRYDHSDLSFSTNTSSRHDYSYCQTGERDDDISLTCSDLNSSAPWTNDRSSDVCFSSGYQADMDVELQKLRIELKHVRGICEMAQNEVTDASKKVNDLNIKRLEETVKFREIAFKEKEAIKLAKEEKAKYEAAKREAMYVTECAEKEKGKKIEADVIALHEAKEKEMFKHALESCDSIRYRKFSWEEIEIATSSFSENLKIGMGSYGTVYKGSFHHTVAAVKVLHSDDGYRLKQFYQELEVLSKMRHPHLLSLLGACPEHGCLIYEFMENGSLEESLMKKNDSPPLPWFERYRIAWEVSSALVYLHNSKPKPVIHRDLKPANILLDRNLVSKIGDVGLSTMQLQQHLPESERSPVVISYENTGPVGTFCYIDPEYQRTGVILPKSDVYAFGVVILQLLTAKSAMGLVHVVEKAIENDSIRDVLDHEAGLWPVEETMEITLLALKCTELKSQDRPHLKDVLPMLQKVKDFADKTRDCATFSERFC